MESGIAREGAREGAEHGSPGANVNVDLEICASRFCVWVLFALLLRSHVKL